MVRIGAMTARDVNVVLEQQQKEPEKLFGQIAIELGYIDDAAVDRYLKERRGR